MTAATLRQRFLDFFASKGHTIVPSAPLINKDDPTLLFINAGMNPFKDVLTGAKPVEHPRIADTQKCLRVSGKHNDLEEVGFDTYHHTFFEMLGNWSFGDYFKEGAIDLAWQFLTEELQLDTNKLYVTVFGGDTTDGLPADAEAEAFWKSRLPAERILRFGRKDNFWEMGDTGPCGPSSEIHIDLRSPEEQTKQPAAELVNNNHPQVIEIWNLVFIQFNRKADGRLETLQMRSIDTGMGLERLALVLQGKQSTYDTDLFAPLFAALRLITGHTYTGGMGMPDVALRVAVDHVRAAAFTIADGQLPSNTGAGYVVRRLIRRALRYGYQYLGVREPFLSGVATQLIVNMGDYFKELNKQRQFIEIAIRLEEQSFLKTLDRGTKRFEEYLAQSNPEKTVAGDFAFELYDTYGFPVDLTQLMAKENGWTVDMPGFEAGLAAQRARSKADQTSETDDWSVVHPGPLPVFVGYTQLVVKTTIRQHRAVKTKKGTVHHVVLAETPFYAESGGQVGDTGWLTNGSERLRVFDTQRENELIVHVTDQAPQDAAGTWTAAVDGDRRAKIVANHSATHLLHAALRRVLGTHVEQRGSWVGPDALRFDFSHPAKPSTDELAEVERLVNEKIGAAIPLEEYVGVPLAEAQAMGAMALFGEKYGDTVRVIRFGETYSTELCGGTHVQNTVAIRYFRLTSEGSVAAGIRRIEAVTGDAAFAYVEAHLAQLAAVSALLKNPQDVVAALEKTLLQQKELERQLAAARNELLGQQKQALLASVAQFGSLAGIVAEAHVAAPDELKALAFQVLQAKPQTVVVLGAVLGDKPLLNALVPDALTDRVQAGAIIKAVAPHIQGGGGGKPGFASAGGKHPAGLGAALDAARAYLQQV